MNRTEHTQADSNAAPPHHPEPWEASVRAGKMIIHPTGNPDTDIAEVYWPYPTTGESGEPAAIELRRLANAQRIVACVNACHGMEDPAGAIQAAKDNLLAAIQILRAQNCPALTGAMQEALRQLGDRRPTRL